MVEVTEIPSFVPFVRRQLAKNTGTDSCQPVEFKEVTVRKNRKSFLFFLVIRLFSSCFL